MTKTFKEAYARLQEIEFMLKSDEVIDVDMIIKLQAEAKKLYEFCKQKITKIENEKKD